MKAAKIIIGENASSFQNALQSLASSGDAEIKLGQHGFQIIELVQDRVRPDLIVLHHALIEPDPMTLCRQFKSIPELAGVPILLVAPHQDEAYYNVAIQAGFDDILTETFNPVVFVARVKSLLKIRFLVDGHDDGESVLRTLARTLEAKDPYTLGHADRVSNFAVELGRIMGVNGYELEILRKGGMLHDLGKIAIPDAILLKPGRFTPEEFTIMKQHPTFGCDICEKLKSVRESLPLIRYHHEKLDGSGYPDGLRGEQIPALVRIVTVVDIYDALRSQRSYKEAFTVDKSFQILWEEANKGWWDKSVVTAWEKWIRSKN